MATQPFAARGLKLQLQENADETIVHCTGKITAENSEVFQSQIRDLIPASRGHVAAIACRIVLDLSNLTHVDSTGLGALLGAWTAAQRKGCELEIANVSPRVEKLVDITKLDSVFRKMKDFFGAR
jgi:anti-anti-sigma factor